MNSTKFDARPSNPELEARNSRDAASPEPDERSSKRLKRGNYVSKACGECKRRKIKCDGSVPCQPCVLNSRGCQMIAVDMRRRRGTSNLAQPPESQRVNSVGDEGDDPSKRELASRLNRLERQLSDVLSVISQQPFTSTVPATASDQRSTTRDDTERSIMRNQAPVSHIPPQGRNDGFSGETSINHALQEIEAYLIHVRELHLQPGPSAAREACLLAPPSPHDSSQLPSPLGILKKHSIIPGAPEWPGFVQNFCDEVHILFPFLHLPTLWRNYIRMFNDHLRTQSVPDWNYTADNAFMIAQTWLCVAIGKCTASPRSNTQDGKHASGWSLYKASLDLIGDLFSGFQDCTDQMLVLQTLALMVVYLFRVDANDRAEKILAIAISHAHHLGLHRSKLVSAMSVFNSELFRRLWWCLYILDRRMAVETGHPVLIQDVNVDTPLPQNLSDAWLAEYQQDRKTCLDLNSEINSEVSRNIFTSIHYLLDTINYSRLVGKVKEATFGARDSNIIPDPSLLHHLEAAILHEQEKGRLGFSLLNHEPQPGSHTSGLPWWQTKQQMLMRIRWLCLRLLVRKPLLREMSFSGDLQNDITCRNIVRNILQEFSEVPEARAKSAFPFLHYLVGATMVALGLICKQPDYDQTLCPLTLHAASTLERYCQITWVSGEMVRKIWRLNQMVKTVVESPVSSPSHLPSAEKSSGTTTLLTGQSGCDSLPSNFRSNPDEPLSPPVERSAKSPGISNLMNAFGPRSRFDNPQFPQDYSTAGFPNLLMTNFEFEEHANNLSLGMYSSNDHRSASASNQSMNLDCVPWPFSTGEPIQYLDAEEYWLDALFGSVLPEPVT